MTCGGERENFLLSTIFFAVSTHCDLKLIAGSDRRGSGRHVGNPYLGITSRLPVITRWWGPTWSLAHPIMAFERMNDYDVCSIDWMNFRWTSDSDIERYRLPSAGV